jgi:hypothetical protein
VFPLGPDDVFRERLNIAGELGYDFVSIVYQPQRVSTLNYYVAEVAMVKLDHVQHEYEWFGGTSTDYFALPGIEQRYPSLSRQGFHLIDYHRTDHSYCEDDRDCSDHDFLLEREKGVDKSIQFIVAHWPLQRKMTMAPVLTAQIKEKLRDGFYPNYVFSMWDILLTKIPNPDELITDDLDVQVVQAVKGVKNKVNALAKQGYRLLLINQGIAVMYRRSNGATPVSYVWLDAKKKDFEGRLQEMQSAGAIYRTIYPNVRGSRNQLIFELKERDNDKRPEYKVLKFDFQVLRYSKVMGDGGKEVHVDLTPSSKEIMKTINVLAKDGFIVRDLFNADKVGVLLERSL